MGRLGVYSIGGQLWGSWDDVRDGVMDTVLVDSCRVQEGGMGYGHKVWGRNGSWGGGHGLGRASTT